MPSVCLCIQDGIKKIGCASFLCQLAKLDRIELTDTAVSKSLEQLLLHFADLVLKLQSCAQTWKKFNMQYSVQQYLMNVSL